MVTDDEWKEWEDATTEVTAGAWLIAADDAVRKRTLPGIADHINRMASAAATLLMALRVLVGIGQSYGDLETGTYAPAEGLLGSTVANTLASPSTSSRSVSSSTMECIQQHRQAIPDKQDNRLYVHSPHDILHC